MSWQESATTLLRAGAWASALGSRPAPRPATCALISDESPLTDAGICREDAPRAKPAPDLYLRAVEVLGVAPEEALALEDSPNGIAAAKDAGLWVVAVPNALTAEGDLSRADCRVSTCAELPLRELLQRLG